jgi:RNA polymerase sigma factor (TIGR02999 family)
VTRTPCDAAFWGEQDTIYGDLHRIAVCHARRLVAHPTLQPTMLVHEAWLRLSGRRCGSRTHYLALASRAMRHFVIDYLRAKLSQKREGTRVRVPLDECGQPAASADPVQTIEIERCLERLAAEDPRKARVVELLVYAGMGFAEIARQLEVSEMTVRRDWQFCRAWLCCALG